MVNPYNSNFTEGNTSSQSSPIGLPVISLDNGLEDNEIWLEGAVVLRTTYKDLFEKYGVTYGEGDGETTFQLPDFRNRAIWGSDGFGYIEAGLPNIAGTASGAAQNYSGAFMSTGTINSRVDYGGSNVRDLHTFDFNAARSSSVYGKSSTVQPPGIKVRVKTRYK